MMFGLCRREFLISAMFMGVYAVAQLLSPLLIKELVTSVDEGTNDGTLVTIVYDLALLSAAQFRTNLHSSLTKTNCNQNGATFPT